MTFGKENAFGRLGTLVVILIFVVVGFLASQIIPFYYYYYEFLGQMEAQAQKASVNTDARIKKFLIQRARELELPIDNPDEDIKIFRASGSIIIETEYEEVLYVDFGQGSSWDLHYFKFHPRVEKHIGNGL